MIASLNGRLQTADGSTSSSHPVRSAAGLRSHFCVHLSRASSLRPRRGSRALDPTSIRSSSWGRNLRFIRPSPQRKASSPDRQHFPTPATTHATNAHTWPTQIHAEVITDPQEKPRLEQEKQGRLRSFEPNLTSTLTNSQVLRNLQKIVTYFVTHVVMSCFIRRNGNHQSPSTRHREPSAVFAG